MSASNDTPIAIIGMGCRFPGGVESPAGLWRLVSEGRDTVGLVPPDRWDAARLMALQDPEEAAACGWGCFLEGDVWAWDPVALSLGPLEQQWTDPQFRVLMEVVWEAVEHAGLPLDDVRGSRTGFYAGVYTPDNLLREVRPVEDALVSWTMLGNLSGTMVGRLAFGMDLRGPAMAITTMCSSGLVAVDTACAALTFEECDLALAGGVMLMISPLIHHYEANMLLSRRGRCYTFDERADGYVRGEGAGVLMLKRLADARRDGDRVLAVIRGSAVNNDGQTTRMTAPSTLRQQELFRAAVARAGIDPGDVGLVETHGPGTEVGDPVEYTSVDAVYGRGRGRCALGSIKTNIGHSEPAAGIAGTIKAVQCLRHGQIPPNLNFRTWNPAIVRSPESRLFVPTEMSAWPVEGEPRLAAVCSYGVTGTNAHIVLEQARPVSRPTPARTPVSRRADTHPVVVPVSAATPQGLILAAGRLADWAEGAGAAAPLDDIAHTLALRRSPAGYRLTVTARTHEELVERSRAFARDEDCAGIATGVPHLTGEHAGAVLVFPGQGSQWPGMCQRLLDIDPVFTAAIDELEPLIHAESGISLRQMITEPLRMTTVDTIHPVLFSIQVALARLWAAWGVRPAAVIGQSMGEVAAAVVAGALSPAEGATVICRRSALLTETVGGLMASVLLGADEVRRDIERAGADAVEVGVITSPEATVISGDAHQVAALVAGWEAADLVVRTVDTSGVASHSAQMDPILDRMQAAMSGLRPRPTGEVGFYSTVTGKLVADGTLDAAYWVANQRSTVLFRDAIASALHDGHRLFVECGPHPITARAVAAVARHAAITDVATVGSLRRDTDDLQEFLTNVGAAHCAGVAVDWQAHYRDGKLVEAPTTAWNRIRSGGDAEPYTLVAPRLVGASQHSLLGGYLHDPDQPERHLWQTPIGPDRLPWLADHQVAGVPILPGTGFAEMMLAAAARVFVTDRVTVTDLVLESPLLLDPEPTVTTRLTVNTEIGDIARVEILSSTADGPVVHAHGTVAPLDTTAPEKLDLAALDAAEHTEVAPAEIYKHFRDRHGVYHGPAFTGLDRIHLDVGADSGTVWLRTVASARISAAAMSLHPALADELAHAVVSVWINRYATSPGPVVVAGIEALRVHGPTARARRARMSLRHADDSTCVADAVLATSDGVIVAEMRGLRLANITPPEQRFADRLTHVDWVPTPAAEPGAEPVGPWLVLAEDGDPWAVQVADALRARHADCQVTTAVEDIGRQGEDGWAGVVIAVPDEPVDGQPHLAARTRVARAISVIQRLAALPAPPRLWIATRTGESTLASAGLRGLLRTAAYEHPELAPSMIQIDADTHPDVLAKDLLAANGRTISEIAWHDGHRHTARLRPGAPSVAGTRALPSPVRAGAAYLISGGLGGLGLVTAQWLAEQGAAHLVLVGRSAPTADVEDVLAKLRETGSTVTVVRGDIGDPEIATHAVHTATTDHPLRGVIHAAGFLQDAILANIDPTLLHRVWRGKVDGAWALHRATTGHELDFWVAYSSVASLIGSPGQAAHASSNDFCDELMAWRLAHGLPATSIHWAGWSEVGKGQRLAERGFSMITPGDGIDALHRILVAGHTHLGYAPFELARFIEPYPDLALSTLFADVRADQAEEDDPSETVLADLQAAQSADHRRSLIESHVIDCVHEILGGTTRHITPTSSLVMLGFDSLSGVQLQNRLQRSLQITIEPGVIWVKPTAAGLAEWIMNRMGYTPDDSNTPEPAPAT